MNIYICHLSHSASRSSPGHMNSFQRRRHTGLCSCSHSAESIPIRSGPRDTLHTHTHTLLSDVREHTHLPSQNTSSPSSPTHTPVTGSLLAPFPQTATRPQSSPKRPAGHAEHQTGREERVLLKRCCLRHIECILLSVWLTEMTAGPDESGRTLTGARDWKTNASVHTLTAMLAAGTVETLSTRYTPNTSQTASVTQSIYSIQTYNPPPHTPIIVK